MQISTAPLWKIDDGDLTPVQALWDIVQPQNGVATGVNFGVPSFGIRLDAERWDIAGGVGVPSSTWIYNYQPIGENEMGNLTMFFQDDGTFGVNQGFIITENGFAVLPPFAGGLQFTYGSSIAATGEGTKVFFKGGNAVGAGQNGGSVSIAGGLPGAGGITGVINIGEFGSTDQGLAIFVDAYIRYFDSLDYGGREEHVAQSLETSDASDQVVSTSIAIDDDEVLRVEATVNAVEDDGSDRGTYRISGVFYRNGGNITQQGTTVYDFVETSDLNWDVGFQLDTLNQTIEVYVNGNGDTVRWTSYLKNSRVTTT